MQPIISVRADFFSWNSSNIDFAYTKNLSSHTKRKKRNANERKMNVYYSIKKELTKIRIIVLNILVSLLFNDDVCVCVCMLRLVLLFSHQRCSVQII